MPAADAKKVEEALRGTAIAGGAACAGVIAICAELVRDKTLSSEAATRIRDAMLADITGSPAPFQARSQLQRAISKLFEDRVPLSPD